MGRVFTITEGLENLGAMKTGGQGSVYKGKRIGPIITAIKLLPTPIYAETSEDKNFVDFQNEVQKLKKVNENPNPNVVKILSSGVSDTGNFPFIEMEYIEGPELEELLKSPHAPIFTIKEALKVSDQLSHALAHCHRVGVKHGDIKSNNVKFNIHTGNYVLLDFGLAVMSDEQRRTSLRHAGAIEFMAPEQNEGQMFFQTDVYSFGVILFELLAGTVPFPLNDKGETARNAVRLAHMETPPPDLLTLRRKALPDPWSDEKKEHEMHVHDWLVSLVYKCLQKKPENRFANGMELNEYIVLNSTLAQKKEEAGAEQSDNLKVETKKLLKEKDQLQQVILKYQQEASVKDKQLDELKAMVLRKDSEAQNLRPTGISTTDYAEPVRRGFSKTAFIALLFLTIAFGGFATYSFFKNQGTSTDPLAGTPSTETNETINTDTPVRVTRKPLSKKEEQTTANQAPPETKATTNKAPVNEPKDQAELIDEQVAKQEKASANNEDENAGDQTAEEEPEKKSISVGRYKARYRAYFHDEPDETTRRNAFINQWNKAFNAINEKDGFIYVIYTNDDGQVSKGWLRKKDLIPVNG